MNDTDEMLAELRAWDAKGWVPFALAHEVLPLAELGAAYEQWEAELIMSPDSWDAGRSSLPTITQELWDKLIELQGRRNAALANLRARIQELKGETA